MKNIQIYKHIILQFKHFSTYTGNIEVTDITLFKRIFDCTMLKDLLTSHTHFCAPINERNIS